MSLLESFITKALDDHAPFRKYRIHNKHNRFLFGQTRALIKERNKARSLATKAKDKDKAHKLMNSYKKFRNMAANSSRKDLIMKTENSFNQLSTPNDMWSAMNSILIPRSDKKMVMEVKGSLTDNQAVIAEEMNKYFITKVAKLGASIDNDMVSDPLAYTECLRRAPNSFALKPVKEATVLRVIAGLKGKSSVGRDEISMKLIKMVGDFLVIPITHIINSSIVSGKFPSKWKMCTRR